MICLLTLGLALQQESPEKIVLELGNGVKMEFVRIKAGKFMMGDKDIVDARPHEVTLTKDYWMQTTETTQAQWKAVMGKNPMEYPSYLQGVDLPVGRVSWKDCQEFLKKLNEKVKGQLKGKVAKLPTEAEWEYACRAGEKGRWCFGDDETKLDEYAWYWSNTDHENRTPRPVGLKKPNAWGLFDMHGNAEEWCEDWWQGSYSPDAATDPIGPAEGKSRVFRGGSHVDTPKDLRSASRHTREPGSAFVGLSLRPMLR